MGKTDVGNSSLDLDSDEVLIKIDCYPPARMEKTDYFEYFYISFRVKNLSLSCCKKFLNR